MIPVLLIEDEERIAAFVTKGMAAEGIAVTTAGTGAEGVGLAMTGAFELVILDLGLPGLDGIEVCRRVRAFSECYVLMLTARGDEHHRLEGLAVGADDYITKPFKPKELVARIRARLRRTDETPADVLEVGDLTVDVPQHTVTRGSQEIQLTPLEFDLLLEMARRPGQVHTRESLLESVWGYRNASDTRLVNVHVQRLRSKIEHDPENPEIILTVRGVGYKTGKAEV